MLHDPEAPRYVTSVAARLSGVPAHMLRAYEKAGLLEPGRTAGRIRLYSHADVDLARRAYEYTRQGVNLAGVKLLLEMERTQQQGTSICSGGAQT